MPFLRRLRCSPPLRSPSASIARRSIRRRRLATISGPTPTARWIKAHPIPADRSSYGRAALLTEETGKRTVDLIQEAAKGAKPGSDAQKVGDYYASFMDEAGIEAKGAEPLKPLLARIAAVSDRTSLAAARRGFARRRRRAQRHRSLHRQHLRPLGLARLRRSDEVCAVPDARRSRHAGSRILPLRLGVDEEGARCSTWRTSPRC